MSDISGPHAGVTSFGGHDVLDVLGIGFGPSNLGLAIAAHERATADVGRALRVAFLERQPRFGWHRGMLLEDATMQISFLKDLVTQRNPASDFSFVNYLHHCGRLTDFINHKTLFPLRIEFHGYLEWAAERVGHLVSYGRSVVDVQPVTDGDVIVAWDVFSRDADGGLTVQRTRDLAIATGLAPRVPPGVTVGPRVWHNRDILDRVETVPASPGPRRFVVVGAGQSAAEVVDFLHRRFPTAEVCSVFTKWGYTPADDSPYANRIFDPDAVDVFFNAGEGVKRMLSEAHRTTNYSVVDMDLIEALYHREYQERVQGRRRLRMMNASEVVAVDADDDAVSVEIHHLPTGGRERVSADAIVYATGYTSSDPGAVLGSVADLVVRGAGGAPEVTRDYRLVLDAPAEAAVYVQGATEHSHGLTSTLLSNIAIRAGEIVESVLSRRTARPQAADRPVVGASAR